MSGAPFWQLGSDELHQTIGADSHGLSTVEATQRLARFGANENIARERIPLLRRLARRLGNPLVAMLIVAATIAGASDDVVSFATILFVILLSTMLDMIQEHRAEQPLRGQGRQETAQRIIGNRGGYFGD